jgi:hypothetical protein
MVCSVLDYWPFQTAVPFKQEAGGYFESGAERRGYFQRGVRVIAEKDFQHIMEAAGESERSCESLATPQLKPDVAMGPAYASPNNILEIESFATEVAQKEIARRWTNARIEVQPRNNPGFDMLVDTHDELLYVEVKGTERCVPQFFITDGELQFSLRQKSRFVLLVVYGINRVSGAYNILWHQGAVSEEFFKLRPVQWACQAVGQESRLPT